MLIHIHIPKNAGSTINTILKRNFQNRYTGFYTDRCGKFLSDSELITLITTLKPETTVLSGHDIRPLAPDASRELGVEYFTFIRHPVEWAISLYYYEKSFTSGQSHISQYPFDEYVLERSTQDRAISNWQTYNLTPNANFEDAQKVLEYFLVVGIVHEFDTSLILLRENIQNVLGIPYFNMWYQVANISRNKKLTSSTIAEKTFKKLVEMNQEDIKLFEYAAKRLEQDANNIRCARFRTVFFKLSNRVYGRVREKSQRACNYWYRGKKWLKHFLRFQ